MRWTISFTIGRRYSMADFNALINAFMELCQAKEYDASQARADDGKWTDGGGGGGKVESKSKVKKLSNDLIPEDENALFDDSYKPGLTSVEMKASDNADAVIAKAKRFASEASSSVNATMFAATQDQADFAKSWLDKAFSGLDRSIKVKKFRDGKYQIDYSRRRTSD